MAAGSGNLKGALGFLLAADIGEIRAARRGFCFCFAWLCRGDLRTAVQVLQQFR